jgi:hypothetical protein
VSSCDVRAGKCWFVGFFYCGATEPSITRVVVDPKKFASA